MDFEDVIPHNRVVLTGEDKRAVQRVLDSGQIGAGSEVEAFERELAERFRPGGEAACVSSGTAALRLALGLWRLKSSSILTLPTYACTALWHAAKGTALSDCQVETLNTPQASVIVHTYGMPCAVAPDAIEDFTHAPGATLDGKLCGSLGALSVISFGATKPLGCGSGGAVLGPADAIAEIKDRRDYDGKRELRPRFNYAWSDMGAALGRSRLARLDDDNFRRWEIACTYAERALDSERVWYRYLVRVPDPSAAIAHFAAHGVQVINPLEPWELLHRQLPLPRVDFPNAEDAAAHTISLPIWPGMEEREVRHVCEALLSLPIIKSQEGHRPIWSREHDAFAARRFCAVCDEPWPCTKSARS